MTYAYITGGGTKWVYDKLKNGGASKWFLGARIPYNQKDFNEILSGEPFDGKYVSERTATQLSAAAYGHAKKLIKDGEVARGLGVTAKLKTTGQRKGRENIIICALTTECANKHLITYTGEYKLPTWLPRKLQEIYCSYLTNKFLTLKNVEVYKESLNLMLDDYRCAFGEKAIVIYSGSFNPMHDAHNEIIVESKKLFPKNVFLCEVALKNFSKNYISPYEFEFRENLAYSNYRVPPMVTSKCATFLEKAEKLKKLGWAEIIFAMGDDTYERITKSELLDLSVMGVKILLFKRKSTRLPNHSIIHPFSKDLPRTKSISSTEIRAKQNEKTD